MLFARRRTKRETRVIKALTARADMSGHDLSVTTGMSAGSLYPILMGLEEGGRITSRWEVETPRPDGSPRRRLYALP